MTTPPTTAAAMMSLVARGERALVLLAALATVEAEAEEADKGEDEVWDEELRRLVEVEEVVGLVVVGALEVSAAVRALAEEEDEDEEDELLDVVRTATDEDDEVTVAGWQAEAEGVSTTIHLASDVEQDHVRVVTTLGVVDEVVTRAGVVVVAVTRTLLKTVEKPVYVLSPRTTVPKRVLTLQEKTSSARAALRGVLGEGRTRGRRPGPSLACVACAAYRRAEREGMG